MGGLVYTIIGDFLIQLGNWVKSCAAAVPAIPPATKVPPMSAYRKKLKAMWDTCVVDISHSAEIAQIAKTIIANKSRYEGVSKLVNNIPWYIIGLFHMRESKPMFSFNGHLANGDPLFDAHGTPIKTVQVPAGLGPFATWDEGAVGALKYMRFDDPSYHWDLINALENIETWNGPGYKNLGVVNPFLFSKTNIYSKGKFVADHKFDPEAVDKQIGCVPVLLALKSLGIDLNYV